MMTLLDVKDILQYLPHRYPFLLIDKVLTIESKCLSAIKNVTANEPFFMGHFPNEPIMPGVLIIEALAQAAGLLIVHLMKSAPCPNPEMRFLLAGVDKVRFKSPVVPGDQLHLHVHLMSEKQGVWRFNGKAMVEETMACRSEIVIVERKDK